MIKIIENGTVPPSRKMQCQNCGCIFSYQREDMEHGVSIQNFIYCPQCGKKIIVDSWFAGEEIFD